MMTGNEKLINGRERIEKHHCPISKPKHKIKMTKMNRTQKVHDGGLKKIGYDPEVVEGFGGIVE